jgi:hypothetical protein
MQGFNKIRDRLAARMNVYRAIAAAGFILAVILVMVIPARMSGASPWAYYYGVKNFASGKLVLTDREMFQEMNDAKQQGGVLMQYVKLGPDRWALEKAPGYVFYLVPFEKLGIPRWGNILLAAGMTVVAYFLLMRMRDEKAACLGSLLMLFSPIGLIMANRAYMDTFASLAFIAMGGGLYFLYLLEQGKWGRVKGGIILFLAFFFISASVVTRQSNLLIAIILALHYAVIRLNGLRKGEAWRGREILPVVMGIGIPAAGLLLYNNYVFGSPLDYGYSHTLFPVKFAYQYLGQVDKAGASIPLNIIMSNIESLPLPLLKGFPVLVLFIPAVIFLLVWKFIYLHKTPAGRWAGLEKEMPWDTLVVLMGWFLSVYVLYYLYEFTAEFLPQGTSFFRYARYYLPGLFPIALVSALVLTRLPQKLVIPIMSLVIVSGIVLYFQVAMNLYA